MRRENFQYQGISNHSQRKKIQKNFYIICIFSVIQVGGHNGTILITSQVLGGAIFHFLSRYLLNIEPFQNIIIAQIKPERKVEKGEGLQPPYLLHNGVYLFILFFNSEVSRRRCKSRNRTDIKTKHTRQDYKVSTVPFRILA